MVENEVKNTGPANLRTGMKAFVYDDDDDDDDGDDVDGKRECDKIVPSNFAMVGKCQTSYNSDDDCDSELL